ncbi:MAG TPA: tol-pal system-associated acyl-CoA thioesterase [Burkholderiaceae bacterium]|nr:tol-pal system-associated acyl-CoA thioesterase [Burkholderiaceae bacterium]HNB47118.1 tol-pal system-associated acyl-CoA thioesterase [Burkholderiaceae bacterium]HNG82574.1 tol-pal system-associated acyl-CoA thioesterase [Burkholderiaceae bacterium]
MTALGPNAPAFAWPVRIYWEDTDAGGVVFYANYLKFFERARTEWLRGLGFSQQAMREADGAIFVVSDTALQYRQPARLDDELSVTVELVEAGRASLTLQQQAWRGATLLAEGRIRIGCVDAGNFRPRRIPNAILERLSAA